MEAPLMLAMWLSWVQRPVSGGISSILQCQWPNSKPQDRVERRGEGGPLRGMCRLNNPGQPASSQQPAASRFAHSASQAVLGLICPHPPPSAYANVFDPRRRRRNPGTTMRFLHVHIRLVRTADTTPMGTWPLPGQETSGRRNRVRWCNHRGTPLTCKGSGSGSRSAALCDDRYRNPQLAQLLHLR